MKLEYIDVMMYSLVKDVNFLDFFMAPWGTVCVAQRTRTTPSPWRRAQPCSIAIFNGLV